jgi:membrane protein
VLLARPRLPRRSLVESAILGAVAFEVLKGLSVFLIQLTHGNPAFRTFGVALILLVWINYTTRVVMFAAAWAYTHPATYEARAAEWLRAPGAAFADPDVEPLPEPGRSPEADHPPEPERERAASTSSGEIPEQPPAGRGRHALRRQRSTD